MPAPKPLDPSASPAAFFGSELRHYRMRAGLSQEQLGDQIGYGGGLVSAVELGNRKPSMDFARRCDKALDTDGALERAMATLDGEMVPVWFRPWLEIEREARTLRNWELAVVPGLLQTSDYARELTKTYPWYDEEQVEEKVTARMERQKILDRDEPPMLWVVLHENVLRCEVGSPKIMHEQLQFLLEVASRTRVSVQVVPLSARMHAGHLGAFAIASLDGEPDVVYLESARAGLVTDRPEDVREMMNIWDAIRTEALPARASLELIEKVMAQWT